MANRKGQPTFLPSDAGIQSQKCNGFHNHRKFQGHFAPPLFAGALRWSQIAGLKATGVNLQALNSYA